MADPGKYLRLPVVLLLPVAIIVVLLIGPLNPPRKLCQIKGRVLYETTGKPVKDALVTLNVEYEFVAHYFPKEAQVENLKKYPYLKKEFTMSTSKDGFFYFSVPSLDWIINVKVIHQGHLVKQVKDVLWEDQTTKDLIIRLCDCSREVYGVVRDRDGSAVEWARVEAVRSFWDWLWVEEMGYSKERGIYREHEPKEYFTFTDRDGGYSLQLPTGYYVIVAYKQGQKRYELSISDVRWIEVGSKSRIPQDFTLKPEQGVVSFRLIDHEGKPIIRPHVFHTFFNSETHFIRINKPPEIHIEFWGEKYLEFLKEEFFVIKGSEPGEYLLFPVPTDEEFFLSIHGRGVYKRIPRIGPFRAPGHLGDIQLGYHPNRVGALKVRIKNFKKEGSMDISLSLLKLYSPKDGYPDGGSLSESSGGTPKEEEFFPEKIAGEYIIVVRQGDLAGALSGVIVYPAELTKAEVVLKKVAVVKGNVVSPDKRIYQVAIGKRREEPEETEWLFNHHIHIASALTDKDGNFLLEGIPPGNWDLMVFSPGQSGKWDERQRKLETTVNLTVQDGEVIYRTIQLK